MIESSWNLLLLQDAICCYCKMPATLTCVSPPYGDFKKLLVNTISFCIQKSVYLSLLPSVSPNPSFTLSRRLSEIYLWYWNISLLLRYVYILLALNAWYTYVVVILKYGNKTDFYELKIKHAYRYFLRKATSHISCPYIAQVMYLTYTYLISQT